MSGRCFPSVLRAESKRENEGPFRTIVHPTGPTGHRGPFGNEDNQPSGTEVIGTETPSHTSAKVFGHLSRRISSFRGTPPGSANYTLPAFGGPVFLQIVEPLARLAHAKQNFRQPDSELGRTSMHIEAHKVGRHFKRLPGWDLYRVLCSGKHLRTSGNSLLAHLRLGFHLPPIGLRRLSQTQADKDCQMAATASPRL